jgi:glycerol-3-phosphate dehydrogenase
VLDIDASGAGAPVLSIFGGKITTYRRLAEHALEKLAPFLPSLGAPWTATKPLPGGDIRSGDFDAFVAQLANERPALPVSLLRRLARAYGTRVHALLAHATTTEDLGVDYGGGLHQTEVDYLRNTEWARTAEDILFRRTKLGIHVPAKTATWLDSYLAAAT